MRARRLPFKVSHRGGEAHFGTPAFYRALEALKLHSQIAGKTIWAFQDNAADAITGNAIEHRLEARTLRNRISAAYRCIVEFSDNGIAVSLSERGDGCSLSLVTILAWPGIRCRRRTEVGDGVDQFPPLCHSLSLQLYCISQGKQYSNWAALHRAPVGQPASGCERGDAKTSAHGADRHIHSRDPACIGHPSESKFFNGFYARKRACGGAQE